MDHIHLSVLRYVYRHPYVPYKDLQKRFRKCDDLEDIVTYLESQKLISFRIASSASVEGTAKYEHPYVQPDSHLLSLQTGNEYVEKRKLENIRWSIPVVLSAIALIVSILSLYKASQDIEINIHHTASTASIVATTAPAQK